MSLYAKFKLVDVNNEAGVACHPKFSCIFVILHCTAVFMQLVQHITVFGLYYPVKLQFENLISF